MRHFRCFGLLVFALVLTTPVRSQSLEDQVLSGRQEPPPAVDLEVPELSQPVEPKNQDALVEQSQELEDVLRGPRQLPKSAIVVAQRRFIRKATSFELTPLWLGVQPTDSFRIQTQLGTSAIYHWTESFGIEILHLHWTQSRSTGLDRQINEATGLEVDTGVDPVLSLSSALLWTPIRAKAAAVTGLVHFESYLTAGGGMNWLTKGSDPFAHLGLGVRLYPSRRLALKFELRSLSDLGSVTRHRMSVWSGASWLLGGGS